jgi:hypothetical protein
MKWLRDVLAEISREEPSFEPVENLLGNYSLENLTI